MWLLRKPTCLFMSSVAVLVLVFILIPASSASAEYPNEDWIALHVNRIHIVEKNWDDLPDLDHPPAEMVCYMVAYLESGLTAMLTYPSNSGLVVNVGDIINTGEIGLSLAVPKDLDQLLVSLVCVDRDQPPEEFVFGARSFTYFLARSIEELQPTSVDNFLELVDSAGNPYLSILARGVIVTGTALDGWLRENDLMGEALISLPRNENWLADGKERIILSSNGAMEFVIEVRPVSDPTIETAENGRGMYYLDASEQWDAQYFDNEEMVGSPALVWSEPSIEFVWASASPAIGLVDSDGFSARWTRSLDLSAGTYRFVVRADDGVRLSLNGRMFIDAWRPQSTLYMKDYVHPGGSLTIKMEYFEDRGDAFAKLSWERVQPSSSEDWYGEYYDNDSLAGTPSLIRNDAKVDFAWDRGLPNYGIGPSMFSARWTRTVALDAGAYRFTLEGNDGIRLYLDNRIFIDGWRDQSGRAYVKEFKHSGGPVAMRLEYYNATNEGLARLSWNKIQSAVQDVWIGEYYNQDTIDRAPSLVRNDKTIEFD